MKITCGSCTIEAQRSGRTLTLRGPSWLPPRGAFPYSIFTRSLPRGASFSSPLPGRVAAKEVGNWRSLPGWVLLLDCRASLLHRFRSAASNAALPETLLGNEKAGLHIPVTVGCCPCMGCRLLTPPRPTRNSRGLEPTCHCELQRAGLSLRCRLLHESTERRGASNRSRFDLIQWDRLRFSGTRNRVSRGKAAAMQIFR